MKKIYLITPNSRIGYDEYEAVVIIAENIEDAIIIAKDHCYNFKKIITQEVGIANDNAETGVLLASFNAG